MTTTIEEGKKGRKISTHILTKRMTWPRRKMEVHWGISTHILTKRMTFTCPCTHNITFYFNSHPHEEDDCYRCISLPTWRYFNSHPHEEDDRRVQQAFQCPWYFNSHPHEEDDTIRLTARGYRYYFNSHPHEEDDGDFMKGLKRLWIFQLTSSRRGWQGFSFILSSA